jgi:hypothetical protein
MSMLCLRFIVAIMLTQTVRESLYSLYNDECLKVMRASSKFQLWITEEASRE